MPVVKEVNFKGEVIGQVELSDAVFGAPVHVPAMHQVVVAHLANCRVGTHDTKDRGDVRGGGKKPWRQKHTGRARAGSSRSPVWVGGGVAHGPHPRDYHQKVNKKVRRIALCSALTLKVQEENMFVLHSFDIEAPKTKLMLDFLASAGAVILGLSNPFSWSRWLTIALFAGALLAAIMGTMKLQAELASRLQFFKSRYACVLLRSYSRLA